MSRWNRDVDLFATAGARCTAVSRQNIALVRDIFETVGKRGDLEAAITSMAPGVEWDMSGVVGWPEERIYRGPEAIREFLEGWMASWSEWHFDIEEITSSSP